MDFKAYAEQKRKKAHKDIIFDICMVINNCACCYNDETRQTECYPLNCVELHKVTANSFYMIPYENSKTNRELIEIADRHGYKCGLVLEDNETIMKFWKE
ncbi:hypothetical protein [Roseburia sp. 1XD42-69]|uniref:hypothetical protein n=1 Tax=Roseburia sp. 1XD42-69 TaxID=2320088 RepID=UPI000EA3D2EA|nr:hypothetical protein [Roseburia sp. 1XD42-69]RKJ68835.1 hypothetical protein D7Y06_00865 [Roseburia sp. 1XD42-69]